MKQIWIRELKKRGGGSGRDGARIKRKDRLTMEDCMKLNGFEELLHKNGIDPGDVFDDRGRCVVTRQGSRASEYPSFEYFIVTTQVREFNHGENILRAEAAEDMVRHLTAAMAGEITEARVIGYEEICKMPVGSVIWEDYFNGEEGKWTTLAMVFKSDDMTLSNSETSTFILPGMGEADVDANRFRWWTAKPTEEQRLLYGAKQQRERSEEHENYQSEGNFYRGNPGNGKRKPEDP